MMEIVLSNGLMALIGLSLVIMVMGSALAKPELPPIPKPPPVDSANNDLLPLPPDLRLRMRRYVRGRPIPEQILNHYTAAYSQRHNEGMRRIRSAS